MAPSKAPAADFAETYKRSLIDYQKADNPRAVGETAITVFLFVACWAGMVLLGQLSIWLTFLLSLPAAGLLVRLFMIQHDCGHGAMFTSRRANDWVGRVLGAMTLTPYDYWRRTHGIHHASSGHLGKRGVGDITTLTVREYRSLPPLRRLAYRFYRHPVVMFAIGPAYLFVIQHRIPVGAMRSGPLPWASTMLTNVAILSAAALLIWLLGTGTFLAIHLPVVLIAASIGVWMFYVQHQFETTSWEDEPGWSHPAAALHGSSYYDLPRPLMWMTGNIGIHHLHHLNSRIPFYRLRAALDAHPELKLISRLTFLESLKCVRLTLWDEEKKRLVPFADGRS